MSDSLRKYYSRHCWLSEINLSWLSSITLTYNVEHKTCISKLSSGKHSQTSINVAGERKANLRSTNPVRNTCRTHPLRTITVLCGMLLIWRSRNLRHHSYRPGTVAASRNVKTEMHSASLQRNERWTPIALMSAVY
jgi:hypothetical protein